jgi:hypothetical protein
VIKKTKTPYIRDLYLAYLIKDAKRTNLDEYPIIEDWMVSEEPPKQIIQWDRRKDVTNAKETAISFYCNDIGFQPILNNPKNYIEKLKAYEMVVGIDASPYDNMPLWVQKSQIGLNIAITYYFGKQGLKIIPNVRIGLDMTITSLEAYPIHTLICVGTNGFIKRKENREIFKNQINKVVDILQPRGICVYGSAPDGLFDYAKSKNIPIYQYDSFTMIENKKDRLNKTLIGGKSYEMEK